MTIRALIMILLAGSLHHASVAEPRVEVFTDRAHPITHLETYPGAQVYRIDGLALAQKQLSKDLPVDEDAARKIATERLAARPEWNEQMMEAGEGLALAYVHYGLDRYPAIVLDGQQVIYGITDLAVARRLYEARP